jgi:agmatinase
MTQQSFDDYVHHGLAPFFRLPGFEPGDSRAELAKRCDVALLGIPYDGGTTYRCGSRLAPYHVRRVSALVSGYHPVHRVAVFEALRVRDCGNIMVPPFDAGAMREVVAAEVSGVLAGGATPVVVGGDHSVTLPILRALARRHGPVAVCHVDAHFDTTGPEAWGTAFHHGTPIRNAIEERLIAPEKLFQVGLRGSWHGPQDDRIVEDFGARRWTADAVAHVGANTIARRIVEQVGDVPLYLSVDIDAIDPSFAPGTGSPIPGGLSSREVLALLRGLAGARIAGMDVVEVTPMLDHADVTCLLAAHLLFEGIALAASSRAGSH